MKEATTGPGRAQRKGMSAKGRATPKGGHSRIGRYTSPVDSGRYTPPIPKEVRQSPRWFGFLILALMILGVLIIVVNYLIFPASIQSPWFLVAGLGSIFSGFLLATRYH